MKNQLCQHDYPTTTYHYNQEKHYLLVSQSPATKISKSSISIESWIAFLGICAKLSACLSPAATPFQSSTEGERLHIAECVRVCRECGGFAWLSCLTQLRIRVPRLYGIVSTRLQRLNRSMVSLAAPRRWSREARSFEKKFPLSGKICDVALICSRVGRTYDETFLMTKYENNSC